MRFSPFAFNGNNLTPFPYNGFDMTYTYTTSSNKESSYTASDKDCLWFGTNFAGGSNTWRYSANNSQVTYQPYNKAGRSSISCSRTICVSTARAGGYGYITFYNVKVVKNGTIIYQFNGGNLGSLNSCPTSITTTRNLGNFIFSPGDNVEIIWYDNIG